LGCIGNSVISQGAGHSLERQIAADGDISDRSSAGGLSEATYFAMTVEQLHAELLAGFADWCVVPEQPEQQLFRTCQHFSSCTMMRPGSVTGFADGSLLRKSVSSPAGATPRS